MVVVQINTVCYGSTGKIMLGIQDLANREGIESYCYYAIGPKSFKKKNVKKIGSDFSNRIFGIFSHITGMMGCFSLCQTLKLIKEIKKYKADVIHLHNLHVSYLNYPVFFYFLKRSKIKTVWTLHDCWPFTGHCPHYLYQNCNKWLIGCYNCPRYKEYPVSSFDNSKIMYKLKKHCFSNIPGMTLVTPSEWLKEQVKKSFLKEYHTVVINNGIDTSKFKPCPSDFRTKYGIEKKFVILGVAFGWDEKKGLDVFAELSKRLDNDIYQIVLVGTSVKNDALLPSNIISIHKTSDISELVGIYSSSDLFVNPTREDNFPLVNIEALACGLPVITFRTGGTPETIDRSTGVVVPYNDVDLLTDTIINAYQYRPFDKEKCVERAQLFENSNQLSKYINLYRSMMRE